MEELQRSPKYQHACVVVTEKDYARQTDLFDAVFSQQAASPTSSRGGEDASGWGAYVLQSRLEVVDHDRWAGTTARGLEVQLGCKLGWRGASTSSSRGSK